MSFPRNEYGVVLVSLIAIFVAFSVMGSAMLGLTGSSTQSQVGSNHGNRAYLMAESGYRYAASEYLNAGNEAQKEARLDTLHDQTFTLTGDQGKFKLSVYPYWYKTRALPTGNQLPTEVLGGFPPDLTLTQGYLHIDGSVHRYISATVAGADVTFQKYTGNWPAIAIGTQIYAICLSSGAQTVTNGGNLVFQANTGANAFPLLNGQFDYNDKVYSYKKLNLTQNRLEVITDPDNPAMAPVSIPNGSNIILRKCLKLHSTGSFGEGDLAAKRKIVYHVPMGWTAGGTVAAPVEWEETFENRAKWTSNHGTHQIVSVGGNKALKITGTTQFNGTTNYLYKSLLKFNWASTEADLAAAWELSGKYLSYDIQVKLFPSSNAILYWQGISFRMPGNGNSLGVAFMQANDSVGLGGFDGDGIPQELTPNIYRGASQTYPMIVLWRQTGGGSARAFLARKVLGQPTGLHNANWTLKDWFTLVVRVQEGATVIFRDGSSPAIVAGDTVTGQNSGAEGKAIADPIVHSGGWGAGTVWGRLILNNVTGTFVAGEKLLLDGQIRARITYYMPRDNYIQVYYGTARNNGTASTNALNDGRKANPRGQIYWPPAEIADWTAATDRFTLLTWNSNIHSSMALIDRAGAPDTILRTDTFVSPASGTFTRPEIALHTFGYNYGYNAEYFDDFAIRIAGEAATDPSGFRMPIQGD